MSNIDFQNGFALGLATNIQSQGGGGAELNIAYGDTEPDDTSKLWIKAEKPYSIAFNSSFDGVESVTNLNKPLINDSTKRTGMACAQIGNKVYMFGGYVAGTVSNLIQVLDLDAQVVTTLDVTLPFTGYSMRCAAVGTKVYLFGGVRDGAYSRKIYVFDTEILEGYEHETSVSEAGYFMSAVTVGNNIYLVGCYNASYFLDSIYIFNTISGDFSKASMSLPKDTRASSSIAVGDKIYTFGGYYYGGTAAYNCYNTIQVYDVTNDTTQKLNVTLPFAYKNIGCAVIGTKIYLFGGYIEDKASSTKKAVSDIVVFDTVNESITTLGTTLPTAMSELQCAVAGNKVYMFGSSEVNSIMLFTLTHDLFENDIEVETSHTENKFNLINTENTKVVIGVKNVYIGDADNHAETCEAYLHHSGIKTVRHDYFTDSCLETSSGTSLTSSVKCSVGDLIVAAIATRDTLTLSDGWNLISTSEINSTDTSGNGQRLSFAYKYAQSAEESITVTQASAQRLYINMVALQGATGFVDCGYQYVDSSVSSITASKPSGLTLWACSAPLWNTTAPYPQWTSSNDAIRIDLGADTQSRLAIFLDNTNVSEVVFTPGSSGSTIIVGSLTIQGIDKFADITEEPYSEWVLI